MIPEELNKIFETFYEDELDISITKVEFCENILTIDFTLTSISTEEEVAENDKRWTMQTVGHKKNKISFDKGSDIRIEEDHPLLWEFKDIQCELYFNGQGPNPDKLHFELYKLHFGLFRNYIPAETYFNAWYSYDLLKANNGLLARGPKRLLMKYAECLQNNGVDFSILDGRTKPENNPIVLSMEDTDTYIIAEDFSFWRQTI
ncbi:MAG TPA: hypothetical protein VL727_09855 [Puia sp.]|nr:hypothetical protein [Puia sp.]